MNERIKEFAKQTLSKDQFGLWLAGDEDIEKFVGLIVRECAIPMMQIAKTMDKDPQLYTNHPKEVIAGIMALELMNYFGVDI
jgi:hypothetical protein